MDLHATMHVSLHSTVQIECAHGDWVREVGEADVLEIYREVTSHFREAHPQEYVDNLQNQIKRLLSTNKDPSIVGPAESLLESLERQRPK